MNSRFKWYGVFVSLFLVCGAGLMLGKFREKDYLSALYERRDFTLLDDRGDFFRLNSMSEKKLALLVFTPDGIPVEMVKPFAEFSRHVDDLQKQGIETYLVSRTNREIVKNFKYASRFPERLLLDTGGTVGRNAGVWPSVEPVSYWAYALVDREFHVLWLKTHEFPLPYEQLIQMLKEAR